MQALYERMQLWMDTRATYGNNPYQKVKVAKKTRGKMGGARVVATSRNRRPRSLFEVEENVELLNKQEDLTAVQNIVEEQNNTGEISGQVVEDGQVDIDWEAELGLDPVKMRGEGDVMELLNGLPGTEVFSVMLVQENPEEPGTYLVSIPESGPSGNLSED